MGGRRRAPRHRRLQAPQGLRPERSASDTEAQAQAKEGQEGPEVQHDADDGRRHAAPDRNDEWPGLHDDAAGHDGRELEPARQEEESAARTRKRRPSPWTSTATEYQ